MEIYLTQDGQQNGPHTEDQLRELVASGSVNKTDLAWHDGLAEWQPLNSIVSFATSPPTPPSNLPPSLPAVDSRGNEAISGRLKGEVRLLEQYGDEIDKFVDILVQTVNDTQSQKPIQKQIDQKMQIYWKQIELVKAQAPKSPDGHLAEAHYYTSQAVVLVTSSGMMRRVSDRSGGSFIGGTMKFATGVIAKQQEKAAENKALELLDKALAVADYPGAHFCKARIFRMKGDNQQAITELNYVISNFPDDEVYVEARQLKDEIENPPKKGMCFIATAAYGSPLAHEVLRLCRFRDEVLLKSKPGRCFVAAYYRISPPLARVIGKFAFLRSATRTLFLRPVLWFVSATKHNSQDT